MADVYTRIGYIKGATGATGAQGAKGDTGDAATIQVGSVTTVPYGYTANVVNSGTEQAAVFDFTIPQGRPGQQTTEMDDLTLNSITTSSASFPIPAIGETGKVLWGKVVKWFSDMAALVATKLNAANVVNNLTTTASGYALDARQGKVLGDIITPTATPLTSVAIGSTYQIPANVLAHNIIIISMARYGFGGSMAISSELIRAGFLSQGFHINRGSASAEYWMAKISDTGLLTMLSSSTSSDAPNVQIVGIS